MKKIILFVAIPVVFLVIAGVVSGGDLVRRPFTTIFIRLGYQVQQVFSGWGASAIGWIFAIIIYLVVWLSAIALLSWIYWKSRKIIGSYKRRR